MSDAVPGRAAQALELRKAGVAYVVIAERLGYANDDEARAEVAPLLEQALADDLREGAALERIRLQGMLTGLFPKARAGDIRAVEQSLKLSERLRLLEAQGAEDNGGGFQGEEVDGDLD